MQTGNLVCVVDTDTAGSDPGHERWRHWLRFDDDEGWYVPGFKMAFARDRDGRHPEFLPLTRSAPYGIRSVAVCTRGCGRRVPNLECTCGFYAFDEKAGLRRLLGIAAGSFRWMRSANLALLEVALAGRVAVFRGSDSGHVLRAERQAILSHGQCPVPPGAGSAARRVGTPLRFAAHRAVVAVQGHRFDGPDGVPARPTTPPTPKPGGAWAAVPTPDLPLTAFGTGRSRAEVVPAMVTAP
jgi:hypothetical protein